MSVYGSFRNAGVVRVEGRRVLFRLVFLFIIWEKYVIIIYFVFFVVFFVIVLFITS